MSCKRVSLFRWELTTRIHPFWWGMSYKESSFWKWAVRARPFFAENELQRAALFGDGWAMLSRPFANDLQWATPLFAWEWSTKNHLLLQELATQSCPFMETSNGGLLRCGMEWAMNSHPLYTKTAARTVLGNEIQGVAPNFRNELWGAVFLEKKTQGAVFFIVVTRLWRALGSRSVAVGKMIWLDSAVEF